MRKDIEDRSVLTVLRRALPGQISGAAGGLSERAGLNEFAAAVGGVGNLFTLFGSALRREFGLTIYPNELHGGSSLAEFSAFLESELRGRACVSSEGERFAETGWRWCAVPEAPVERQAGRAVFILSTARSGSTLLRVMLAGHPALFAPPELYLLQFESMGSRRDLLAAHGYDWMRLGALTAIQHLDDDADIGRAQAELERLETGDRPVAELYQLLEQRACGRLLVDKTPLYSAYEGWMRRAEALFVRPMYVHLVRHPYAMMESFVRLRFHRLFRDHFPAFDPDPWVYAEQAWTISNQNIERFLQRVDADRQVTLRCEDLQAAPEEACRRVFGFLGVSLEPDVLDLYAPGRMTRFGESDQFTPGDPDFLRRRRVESAAAEAWKKVRLPRGLGPEGCALAARYEYEVA